MNTEKQLRARRLDCFGLIGEPRIATAKELRDSQRKALADQIRQDEEDWEERDMDEALFGIGDQSEDC